MKQQVCDATKVRMADGHEEPSCSSKVREAPVCAPRGVGDSLLCQEACRRNHRQAAVLQLLRLHRNQLVWIRRLEAQGVEAEVTRHVVGAKLLEDVVRIYKASEAYVRKIGSSCRAAKRIILASGGQQLCSRSQ